MSAEYKVYSCSPLKLQSSFFGTAEFHTYHPAIQRSYLCLDNGYGVLLFAHLSLGD